MGNGTEGGDGLGREKETEPQNKECPKGKPGADECKETAEKTECGQGGRKGCAGLLGQQKKEEAEQGSNKEDKDLQLSTS